MASFSRLFYLFILGCIFVTSAVASAQQSQSINVGGGTLTYDVSYGSQTIYCGFFDNPYPVTYDTAEYSNFHYLLGSNYYTLNADSFQVGTKGLAGECEEEPPQSSTNPTMIATPFGSTIKFSADEHGNAWAGMSSVLDPAYKILSIVYAAPGDASSNGYTNNTSVGTTTTIGSSFQTGTSVTFGGGFLGASATVTLGTSQTIGQSDAFTQTIAQASGINNASGSLANTIDHSQDLFVIWLNPEVQVADGDTSNSVDYSVGTRVINGVAQPPDIVRVFGAQIGSTGTLSIPLTLLQPQYNPATGQNDLPGLASVCADQSQYTAVPSCPLGGQCGCTVADFADIRAADPLISGNTKTDPYSVNGSGSACASPSSSLQCRYVPIFSSGNVQQTALLQGPTYPGGNHAATTFSVTDTSQTAHTFSQSYTESVRFDKKFDPPFHTFVYGVSSMFAWTNMESTGQTNSTGTTLQYSLSSNKAGCYQQVLIYQDTVFHTFVTRQEPGNTSCD